jgi:hypothetical protein
MRLHIATEFAEAPGPRKRTEGPHSGEAFRQDLLMPVVRNAMAQREPLTVVLDGTAGFGTSFLEEAFGGLIREDGLTLEQLDRVMTLESSEEPDLIDEIRTYLTDAEGRRQEVRE